jgi:hypothetical protein
MGWDLHIYGGFNISPYLALRVFEVFDQITAENVDPTLSHTDDDDCPTCKAAAEKESRNDAPGADRPGRQRVA